MTPAQEIELFARMPTNQFEAWLDEQHAVAVRYLSEAMEPVAIHRAQGKVLFINEMKKLLARTK